MEDEQNEEVPLADVVVPDEKPDVEEKPAAEEKPPEEKPATAPDLSQDPTIAAILDGTLEVGELDPKSLSPEQKVALGQILRAAQAEQKRMDAANATTTAKAKAEADALKATAKQASLDRQALAKWGSAKSVKDRIAALDKDAKGDGLPADPDSAEGQKRERAGWLRDQLAGLFGDLEGVAKEEKEAAARAEAEAAKAATTERWNAFIAAHVDDFDEEAVNGVGLDGKPANMVAVMRQLTRAGLDLPDAYQIAIDKRDAALLRAADADAVTKARAANQRGVKRDSLPLPRKGASQEEITKFMLDNPETAKAVAKDKSLLDRFM